MQIGETVKSVGASVLAGYVGTKVMEPVAMGLYKLESSSAREQEDSVRPGPPYKIAAQKTFKFLGLRSSEKQLKMVSKIGFHYGLGMGWAPLYLALRRFSGMSPIGAGVVTGATLSLIVDEAVGPALGYTAKSKEYPVSSHVRGFVAHLAYGIAAAGVVELIYKLMGRGENPQPRRGR